MDLSHHLSAEARRRQPSLLKETYKYMIMPDMRSLGGGLPHPSMFPISHASFDFPVPPLAPGEEGEPSGNGKLELWSGEGPNGQRSTLDLTVAQQYAAGAGFPELTAPFEALTKLLHSPPSEAKHEVACTQGNTDGVAKVMRLLLNPGDNMLFEEFTFPGPVENARSMGVGLVPVRLDSHGADPARLDEMLESWNAEVAGPKPRVFYMITVGQNPTGTTASLERLQALYEVGRKHDLIFLEDDPYYFIQLGPYVPNRSNASRTPQSNGLNGHSNGHHTDAAELEVQGVAGAPPSESSMNAFSKSLCKTLLSLDMDGRVVRIDTLSKIIFPGSRLGWVTLNPLFRERYERISEVSTQMGNDKSTLNCIGQALFAQMLTPPSKGPNNGGWGLEGFARWINHVRRSYAAKRDFFLDVLRRECPPELGFVSCVAAEAGMFIWIRLHLEKHPRFEIDETKSPKTNTAALVDELFHLLVTEGCLILPAHFFAIQHTLPADFEGKGERLADDMRDRCGFLRATFAGTEEIMETALVRFGKTMKAFFAPAVEA